MSRYPFSSRVRAHKDVNDSEDEITSSASSSASDNSRPKSDNAAHRAGDVNEEESSDDASLAPEIEATSLSFGDLVRAQASIQSDQQPAEDPNNDLSRRSTKRKASDALEKPSSKKHHSGSSRSSKHAPQALSSKHAVSRTRTILPTNKPASRDPRFDPLAGNLNSNQHNQNYSFLKDYRNTEISSLKSTLKALDRRKGLSAADREAEREGLKSAIQRLTSKTKTEQFKDKEREVIRQHRKEERDKVRGGKQPYFLKRGELKKRVEDKRFEGVGEKKKERIMEKRRKKQAGKEKKLLPERRVG